MSTLNGKYGYQSFCPRAASATTPAEIAAPWAGPAELDATTDATGVVTAKLTFRPGVALEVKGHVVPAGGAAAEGFDLTGEGLGAVYRIRGYFVTGKPGLAVGTVMLMAGKDPAGQPLGAHGPFVLAS